MKLYFGPARNSLEVVAARDLAVKTFGAIASKSIDYMNEYKEFLWEEPDFPGQDHIIIMATNSGEVVGTIRLLPRKLYRNVDEFVCAGISSVCIDERYRGDGYSYELMNATLEQAQMLGYEIVALFARRELDHYYPKFGIWGLSSYNRLTILQSSLPAIKVDKLNFQQVASDEIPLIQQWHKINYKNCFGYIERNKDFWKYLLKKIARQNLKLDIIRNDGNAVGYVILCNSVVVEIAIEREQDVLQVLKKLILKKEVLELDLPSHHNILHKISSIDTIFSYRQCEYGGHMLGILNPNLLCKKLEARIKRHAVSLKLMPQQEKIDGLVLDWNGAEASVQQLNANKYLNCATTARLVGAKLYSKQEQSRLAPCEALNFLMTDHM